MEKLNLRCYDGIAIVGFLMLPALFSTGISTLVEENGAASWLVLLLAFGIMLCIFLVILPLMRRHESSNIIEITTAVMGKPLGVVYGIALGSYFCYFSGIHIRESSEILKIYGLHLTPLAVIAGLILATAVIMNFLGGKSIVKTAGFFFLIVMSGIVLLMLLGINRYHPDNLVPLLGNGIPDIAKNGLFSASLFNGVIILYLFAPAFSNVHSMKQSGITAILVISAVYVLLCLCYMMMFSPYITAKMISGFMEMGKSSYYNHFFNQFESILLFFLIFTYAMAASISLFIAKESFACTFALTPSKTLTLICAVLILIVVFIPVNILELTKQYLPILRKYGIFFMAGFPLLVSVVHTMKRKFQHEKN